ncbi:MAG: PEP-CTERM sorting domain-containing protein [Phycisphaerales bacterium]|nr:PEP-CTERM sorting domain-containing protein [Phycisphaerales bacterium]
MTTRQTSFAVLSLAAVAGLGTHANAAITGWTGNATQIAPPPSATFGSLTGAPARAWDEQQGFIAAGLPVDLSINPSSSLLPTAGVVNGLVDSHFIHLEDFSGASVVGTVSFNNPIVGVAYSDLFLDASDGAAGAGPTAYPTFTPFRGINSFAGAQSIVSISGNTISFDLLTTPGIADFEQIRVYTRVVPAPGSMALLGAGGLLAARRRRVRN